MVAIFADVPDQGENAAPTAADAQVAVARLLELSADARGCVILDPRGEPLAARGPIEYWGEAGRAFAVRRDDLALVAATERFTRAGLFLVDARAVLRELARGPAAAAVAAPQREAA